ncbi:IPP transferase [Planctomycetes bacterium CA13]|uniref:tRNA dimethylallyltransferase n=1 Tax=Novipirellula herctigrandis TaxID=2527986 RepID=A0A5C5Z5P5_9BACT|nr:IPP transferase [Planctomycetes bacterium CA13]
MDDRIDTYASLAPYASLAQRVIVITGPTASGKSEIALELAARIGGEILSLDSIAVYRGMDIGTAKPTLEDQNRVPHHLIDLVDPNESFSVACYLKESHRIVDELEAKNTPAIFVGGTPMFLKAVLRGFDPGPPADEAFRQSVERDLAQFGPLALHQRLQQVDPLAAHRIAPTDARRMIRALEVAYHTGQPLSHRQIQFDQAVAALACNVFWMSWDRAKLHHRINERVNKMFTSGLVQEVRGLLDNYGTLSKTAAQAVGYRELIESFETDNDLEKAKEFIAIHTRQLAKRQETWFRSFSEIRTVSLDENMNPESVAANIEKQLV